VLAYGRLISGGYEERKVRIRAPKEAGTYQLRYYNADSDIVLFETGITIE
jgi:hypothetical protein